MKVSDLTDEHVGSRIIIHCQVFECDNPDDQTVGTLDSFEFDDDATVVRVLEEDNVLVSWIGYPDVRVEVIR